MDVAGNSSLCHLLYHLVGFLTGATKQTHQIEVAGAFILISIVLHQGNRQILEGGNELGDVLLALCQKFGVPCKLYQVHGGCHIGHVALAPRTYDREFYFEVQRTPKLSEFTNSAIANKQGTNNTPMLAHISNLQYLCTEILEPLRIHFQSPIFINSGYRSPELNKAVGGARNSNHLIGCAADIHIPTLVTGQQWFKWIEDNCNFDELLWEQSAPNSRTYWIHVAIRKELVNRRKIIRSLLQINNR